MGEATVVFLSCVFVGSVLYLVDPAYVVAAAFVPVAYLAVREARHQERRKKIEEELPRAMLELATLPVKTLRDVIDHLSRGYGELSSEFRRVRRLVSTGIPPEKAMRAVAVASGSYLFNNAVTMLITGMRSGSNWSELIRNAAEDIEALIDMERERASALALQRYAVLLSAGLFVPGILGITKRMVDRLTESNLFEATDTLTAVQDAVVVHIALLAVMSAVFVALLEGRPKKAIIYAVALLPLSFCTYLVLSGMGI